MPKYKVGDRLLKDGNYYGEVMSIYPATNGNFESYSIYNGIEKWDISLKVLDDNKFITGVNKIKVENLSTGKLKQTVSHPPHYNQFSIEVIEMMRRIYGEDKVKIFCELNAFKYKMRAGEKGDPAEDLEKAKWYLNYKKELEDDLPF